MRVEARSRAVRRQSCLVSGIAVFLSACGGSESLAPPVPASIVLSQSSLSFDSLGGSAQLVATVSDQYGAPLYGTAVTWRSSDSGIVAVSSSGLVTATGNGSAIITATSGAARSTVGATVDDPDPDRDGIVRLADECPLEPETVNGWADDDGCPDETTDLYEFARQDIETYWQAVFTASSLSYASIGAFQAYSSPVASPCGPLSLNNAWYCVVNFGVYYHLEFMDRYLSDPGDMAPAFIVSHEIGHHVTFLLRYFNPAWQAAFPSLHHFKISMKQSELMADCFGGAWVANADQRGLLDEGDGEEVVNTLIAIGDTNIPWFSPEGHGTSQQRLTAFLIGVISGPSGCVDTSFFDAFPADEHQPAPPPNPLRGAFN